VLRVLTQRKVVDYLRTRRGPALSTGAYTIEVVEGRTGELVAPERPDGIKLQIPSQPTLWGRIEFSLYVAPPDDRSRRVAIVGRAGATITDDVAELEEFSAAPWTTNQVSGQIIFESLQQSAGRRAVLRDRDAFPVFLHAVRGVEPLVVHAVTKVTREVDEQTADRLAETLRKVFGRVLRELADLDNPMRSPVGDVPGDGGMLSGNGRHSPGAGNNGSNGSDAQPPRPDLPDLDLPDEPADAPTSARPDRNRHSSLPSVQPDPTPGENRSRFDAGAGVVFYNDHHADYLLVKDDEAALLDYLATLIAKEYVLYNNPRATPDDFAEEIVRMLVRVRKHLPRRRR
jgi:hypothetical protein